ncbi:carboxymethylenebutenolidase-related protein [Nonlabens marinus S1-08]|uniref:Carboxymethylenebutenolidase-related protein n=1 Tax=Nonlabens marinus S1-08 TaxID=1454201 RepID=W8VSL6_9FLAO|nr:carboxymethylenebutenolidase-related protein [Nonlabens marinus S1-08]
MYVYISFSPQGFDQEQLRESKALAFMEYDGMLSYTAVPNNDIEIIFLPGALVDPEAYEPLAASFASKGYDFSIVKMPWRMADLGYQEIADKDLFKNPKKKIVIMGHSKGGKMAAQFVKEYPIIPDALVLLGTTHPRDIDLSLCKIPVLKISGSRDFIAPVVKSEANADKLPPHATHEIIKGGNHSQFGFYGKQFGDGKATISREEQLDQVVQITDKFLNMYFFTPSIAN